MDILLAFPAVLLALGIVAVLGRSASNVIIAVGIANIPAFARVARASVLGVMVRPHIRSAVALGAGSLRIFLRHVLPNIAGPMIVLTMLTSATAILVGSTLSFLGLGAAPPSPEWGVMLSDARAYMQLGWWLTIVPGSAIALTVLALNLLGDGLRDTLDPTSPPWGSDPRSQEPELVSVEPLLDIEGSSVDIGSGGGSVHVVRDASIQVRPGEVLGLVGESGCGKTTIARSVVRLLPPGGRVVSGRMSFDGASLLDLSPRQMSTLRGGQIGFIFQNPSTSLNPVFTVGRPGRRAAPAAPGTERSRRTPGGRRTAAASRHS